MKKEKQDKEINIITHILQDKINIAFLRGHQSRDEEIAALKDEIERKDAALKEALKMAIVIGKCTLEPDKVCIHNSRLKFAIEQALEEDK